MVNEQRILYLSWFTGWWLGKRNQYFGLFMFHILLIYDPILSKFNKLFLSDKSSKVFRRWQSYANAVIFTGDGLQNHFFCSKPRCLCFEDCWINCFIRSAIKRSMIITFNQEFIAFNKPMILFLFSWCLIFCLTFPFHLTFSFPYFIERLKILIFFTFYFLVLTFY